MSWLEGVGYLASRLVPCTFHRKTMVPLRCVATGSNLAFMTCGHVGQPCPVLVLHLLLLPRNIVRLPQIRRRIRDVSPADHRPPARAPRGAEPSRRDGRLIRALLAAALALAAVACDTPAAAPGAGRTGPPGAAAVRVAAVGDSITEGSGLADPGRDSYPAQLGRILGARYEVRNFGAKGHTLLRRGDRPYWQARAFEAARAFAPDLVVLMLGTNDATPRNWAHRDRFVADYAALIDAFSGLPSRPKVWVCYPVPTFGRHASRDPVIRQEVIPRIARAARERQVPVIDLYRALQGRADLFPDGIHPSAEGARVIAETVARALGGG